MKKYLLLLLLLTGFAIGIRAQVDEEPPETEIRLRQWKHDFGKFPRSQKKAVVFVIDNVGQEPLIIKYITLYCKCTTAKWTKRPVPPGGKAYVRLEFDGSRYSNPGHFTREVIVRTNTKHRYNRLEISGEML